MINWKTTKYALSDGNFVLGLILVSLVVLTAIISLFYTPYDPNVMNISIRLQGPSPTHLLGTDQYGRDLLSRVMRGAINSLLVGVIATTIGASLGILFGVFAGYYGHWLDETVMRVMDVVYGFPAVLSAVLIASVLGPGIRNSMIAIGVSYVPIFARLVRGSFLSIKELDYVTAAKSIGRSNSGIILKHILPNALAPLIVQATVSFAVAILAEAGLSYLGLGTQPPHPSWGSMLKTGQTFISYSIWPVIFPGLAIAVAVLGFNLLGDGLRDVLDPKLVHMH